MLITAAWTLGIAFSVFSYGSAIASLFFPLKFGEFMEQLGSLNAAANYYERNYQRDSTPKNMYLTLEKFTQANNSEKVIEYFELLYFNNNDDYKELVDGFNDYLFDIAVSRTVVSKKEYANAGNEDSRMKSAYVRALLHENRGDDAKAFCITHCTNVNLQYPQKAFFEFAEAGKQSLIETQFNEYFSEFQQTYSTATLSDDDKIRPLFFLAEGAHYLNDANLESYQSAYFALPTPATRG